MKVYFWLQSIKLVKGGAYLELWTSNGTSTAFGSLYVNTEQAQGLKPGATLEFTLTNPDVPQYEGR